MKKVIIGVFTFLFSLILIDFAFSMLMRKGLAVLSYDNRLRILKEEENKEIVIMGSSRGARNLDAKELEKLTKKSCYNLGFPGSDLTFHLFLLKYLIKINKVPKTIVLTLDGYSTLCETSSLTFRTDELFSYTDDDYIYERVNHEMKISESFAGVFNSTRYKLAYPKLFFRKKFISSYDTLDSHGNMLLSFYSPKYSKMSFEVKVNSDTNPKLSDNKLKAFKELISLSEKHRIKIIPVITPIFGIDEGANNFITGYFQSYNIPVVSYDVDYWKKHKSFFSDPVHLTKDGAFFFSRELFNKTQF